MFGWRGKYGMERKMDNHTSSNIRWSSERSIKDHTEERESLLELVKKCMRQQRQNP